MHIRIEPSLNQQIRFPDLRDRLVLEGRKFDEQSLQFLSYNELQLCCIGNAGPAICSAKLVQDEKAYRRERFLSLEPEELNECERFLRNQNMYDDILHGISSLGKISWKDLDNHQKVWAKLYCLFNHLDEPQLRLEECHYFLQKCFSSSSLPVDVVRHYKNKVLSLLTAVGQITDDLMRNQIEEIKDDIRDFLPEEKRSICTLERIRDFRCSSDCFRL